MTDLTWRQRLAGALGLNRNIAVLAASIFFLGMGEELWQAYLPKYLEALGATGVVVGVFASCKDLLDGLYQYPGGWVNDRYGRKRALMLFTMVAMTGYVVYACAFHWAVAFAGLVLVMAWKSGAFPATFAIIGDALPVGKRVIAFSVQSILVRLPRVIGAPLGGLLIVACGVRSGIQIALGITLALAVTVLLTQRHGYRERIGLSDEYRNATALQVFRQMQGRLKRLLLADCLIRIGEGISLIFIVLYVTDVLGLSASEYGILYAIQQSVAIMLYLPSGKLAELTGRTPLVSLTFLFFALFPLAVQLSGSFMALVPAFIVGGLREMGEPARKSMIVDLSDPGHRGRSVGVYYTIRNLLVVPAGTLGGLLWQHSTRLPFQVSFVVGMIGVATYIFTFREDRGQQAGPA